MKIVKIIFSSLFSILLFAMLFIFISLNIAKDFTSEKVLNRLLKDINVEEIILTEDGNYTEFGETLKDKMVEAGVPEDLVVEFVKSEPVEDFIIDYVDNTIDYVLNDGNYKNIEAADLENLINDNIDEIVKELKENDVPGSEQLTAEKVDFIKSQATDLSNQIASNIPNISNRLGEVKDNLGFKLVKYFLSDTFNYILLGIIVFLVIALILLNFSKCLFGYWIGIPTLVVATPFLLVGTILNVATVTSNNKFLERLLSQVIEKVLISGIITFIVGILFIVLSVVVSKVKRQKNISKDSPEKVVPLDKTPTEPEVKPTELEVKKQYCAYCGSEVLTTQEYCYNCGAKQK